MSTIRYGHGFDHCIRDMCYIQVTCIYILPQVTYNLQREAYEFFESQVCFEVLGPVSYNQGNDH